MPTIKQFEEFTSQWQSDHKGKYPTSFDYFLAIWEAAKKDEATKIERLKNDLDIFYAALQKQNIRIEGQTMNTPRTDKEIIEGAQVESGPCHDMLAIGDCVSADFARQLETKVQELRAALEFYANESAYEEICDTVDYGSTTASLPSGTCEVMEDYGTVARAALAKVPK